MSTKNNQPKFGATVYISAFIRLKTVHFLLKIVIPTLFSIFCLQIKLDAQNKIYVNAAAGGANNGSSWENAYINMRAALLNSHSGDEIWVAQGVYKPTASSSREIAFQLPSGVRMIGGFIGTETDAGQRDWAAHPVILSGDIGTPGMNTDNSFNILRMDYPDISTLIDGFVFEFGYARIPGGGTDSLQRNGGAIYILGAEGEAYGTIQNCTFRQNEARNFGGAVFIDGGENASVAPHFHNCIFTENKANLDGGAVYRNGSSWVETPDFSHCVFAGNIAGRNGGGLYYKDYERSDTINIEGCKFYGNHTQYEGGAIYLNNGRFTGSLVKISHCDIKKNEGSGSPAISIINLNLRYTQYIEIADCAIDSNIVSYNFSDPTILTINNFALNSTSKLLVSNVSMLENVSNSLVSVVKLTEIEFVLANVVCSNVVIHSTEEPTELNFSSLKILQIDHLSYSGPLATINLSGLDSLVIYNSLIKNTNLSLNILPIRLFLRHLVVRNTSFINYQYFFDAVPASNKTYRFTNCIFLNFYDFVYFSTQNNWTNAPIKLDHCFFSQGAYLCTIYPQLCVAGNIFGGDPLFANAAAGDYRLLPCSPLVNSGKNSVVPPGETDLNGQARIQGGAVDIGPHEAPPPSLSAPPVVSPACENGQNGAVVFTLQNSCPPYVYEWDNGDFTGAGLNQLVPGDYLFTITDAGNAAFTTTVTIPVSNPLSLVPQAMPLICGDTIGGTAAVSVLNGNGPYQFHWSGFSQTDSLLSNLGPGTYALSVTDAQGCTAMDSVVINRVGSLQLHIEVNDISCFGADDGSLLVEATNGKAPYLWQWENGPSSPAFGPLGPGTYGGTLTDAFGCSIPWILPLTGPAPLEIIATVSPATDTIQANGTITIDEATGGSGTFSALWSTGTSGFQLSGLLPGTYTVTVSDAHECTVSASYTIGFTVAVGEPPADGLVQVFPNPATDEITVAAPTGMAWTLYDALGRPLRTCICSHIQEQIQVRDLPDGIYFWQTERARGRLVLY